MTVLTEVRRVLDEGLVVGNDDAVTRDGRVGERDEALARAEQAGAHRHPLRRACLVVDVHLTGGTDLGAVGAVDVAIDDRVDVVLVQHGGLDSAEFPRWFGSGSVR